MYNKDYEEKKFVQENPNSIFNQNMKEVQITGDKESIEQAVLTIENEFLESIGNDTNESSMKLLDDLSELIKHCDELYRRNKMIEVLVLTYYKAHNLGIKEDNKISYYNYIDEILNSNINELETLAYDRIEHIITRFNITKVSKSSKIISDVTKYMSEYYYEGITLDQIAENVSITPQYLSKIFKEETGCKFIEWLTNVRINKAKELMKTTNKTIKEICFEVGYNDPNYFSRLFKRLEGKTISEYAKENRY